MSAVQPEWRTAVGSLMSEFGFENEAAAQLAALCAELARDIPDLLPLRDGKLQRTSLVQGLSDGMQALLETLLVGDSAHFGDLLAAWGQAAALDEPVKRMRQDGQRLGLLLADGARRLYAADGARSADALALLQRWAYLQSAVLSEAMQAGSQPLVVNELPVPDYAPFMELLRVELQDNLDNGTTLGLMLVYSSAVARADSMWGYQKGDVLRQRIAQRLKVGVVRPTDRLGQVSRDQIACILPDIGGEGVALLAVQKVLRALEEPISLGDFTVPAGVSVGIALFPEHGDEAAVLLRHARVAALAAQGEQQRYAVYHEAQEEPQAQQVQYEARLRNALEVGALELVYQPQLELATRRITGVECLLRWTDELFGVVPPNRTLAIAEAAGLLNELTGWVFNTALRQCAEFHAAGLDIDLSINLSASNLFEPDLAEFVNRALRTWDVEPQRLVIEITETAMLGDLEHATAALQRLKDVGVRLAIDDFGTGYSPMFYLARLPFDELKIDQSFVSDMLQQPRHGKIVQSLIELAHRLGMRTVAEGAEDEATAAALAAFGCDMMQGYHGSEPLPAAALIERFRPA